MSENRIAKVENSQPSDEQLGATIYEDIRAALAEARSKVVVAANAAMVGVYHEIGTKSQRL
jgi:hypothetical protein